MSTEPKYTFNLGRAAQWLVINVAQWWIAYAAAFEGKHWAENTLAFITAFQALMALAVFSDSLRTEMHEKGPCVPIGLNFCTDLIVASVCAAQGWFWLATAWAWIGRSSTALYHKPSAS